MTNRTKLRRLIVIALMAAIVVGSPITTAQTDEERSPIVVDDDQMQCANAGFTTIQAAIDAASTGQTIEVCTGTYEESVTIDTAVAVTTTGSVTLDGDGVESNAIEITTGNVLIEGLIINNYQNAGIVLSGAPESQIRDTVIYESGGGIVVQGTGTASIRNNVLRNNEVGVDILDGGQAAEDLTIETNRIHNNTKHGIRIGEIHQQSAPGDGDGTVNVALRPTPQNVSVGQTTTYAVVLEDVNNGVGSYEFVVNTSAPGIASIIDATPRGTSGESLTDVTVAENGTRAVIIGANTDTRDRGTITAATVTLEGETTGTAVLDLSLRKGNPPGDENGNPYTISSISDASVTVIPRAATNTKAISITRNDIRNNGQPTASTAEPLGGIGIGADVLVTQVEAHRNVIAGNREYGIYSGNDSAAVNATANYWGAPRPSSPGEIVFEDPETRAPADGNGDALSGDWMTRLATVQFDPSLEEPPLPDEILSLDATVTSRGQAGGQATVAYTVTNTAMEPQRDVILSVDELPTGVTINTTSGAGTFSPTEQTVRYDEVPAEDSVTSTITFDIAADVISGQPLPVSASVITDDNRREGSTTVNIRNQEPNFETRVISTNSPIVAGEILTVETEVSNVGTTAGTQLIGLSVGGNQRDTATVSLEPRTTTTVPLVWTTTDDDAGTYTVTITSQNDTTTTTATVTDPSTDDNDAEDESDPSDGDDTGGNPTQSEETTDEEPQEVDTTATPSQTQETDEGTQVTATAEDVRANDRVNVDVSTIETDDESVAVDAIEFTAQRSGDISLTVTQSPDPLSTSPTFDRSDGTKPAGYVNITHSIANSNVENVTVEFRVAKDNFSPAEEPDDVALYRATEGTTIELPTTQVRETETHYIFQANSPGLSDFVVGIKQARFQITNALVTVADLTVGEQTRVQVQVTNTGGADGIYRVELFVNNESIAQRDLTIAANGTRRTVFAQSLNNPGEYRVAVNNITAGTVVVREQRTEQDTTRGPTDSTGSAGSLETTATSRGTETETFIPGFGISISLLAILLTVVLFARSPSPP